MDAQPTTNTDQITRLDRRWQPWAACASSGPQPFYANHNRPQGLCAGCGAAEPCLWAAMALEQVLGYRYGLWGGTSAQRRARIAASLPYGTDYTVWYQTVVDAWSPPAHHAAQAA